MKTLKFRIAGLLGALAVVFAGCDTISRAREAQNEIIPVTYGIVMTNSAKVNLRNYRLVDYVAFAYNNRPNIRAAELAVSNAVLNLVLASSGRYIQINGSGGYSQTTANGSHFSWHQERGRGTAGIDFKLLICDFGRIDAREKAARFALLAAQRNLADEEFLVFNEVSKAYFTLLKDDALLDVARTNEFQYAEHLKEAESLYDAGEVKKLDVLKARVDLSDARLSTINASNSVITSGADFMRSLGLQANEAVRDDVIAVERNHLDVPNADLPKTFYQPDEALELARTNAPSIKVLRAELAAAASEVDYAVSDLMPEVSLRSTFMFTDPAWNWNWGLDLIQSLFLGYRKTTAVDLAVVAMQRARENVEEAEQRLSHDLAVAIAGRDNAREAFKTALVQVEQARENLDNVREEYKVGEASRIDFADAVNNLTDALGTRIRTFYTSQIAEAELIRLTGAVPEYPEILH